MKQSCFIAKVKVRTVSNIPNANGILKSCIRFTVSVRSLVDRLSRVTIVRSTLLVSFVRFRDLHSELQRRFNNRFKRLFCFTSPSILQGTSCRVGRIRRMGRVFRTKAAGRTGNTQGALQIYKSCIVHRNLLIHYSISALEFQNNIIKVFRSEI